MASKVYNWAEATEDDYLPPTSVEGPDAKGIKIVTEYKKNDNGQKIKVVRKMKVITRRKRVSKKIHERKQWERFGASVEEGDHLHTTFVSKDEVKIESPEEAEKNDGGIDILETIKSGLIKKELAKRLGEKGINLGQTGEGKGLRTGTSLSRGETSEVRGGVGGKYLPPGARGGGGGGGGSQWGRERDESCTLRVTNISEDATEKDLQDLFREFGTVSRIFLAKDKETGVSRGFAYVSYIRREDAERAKEKLDGYGYDYLILKIEWAKPSSKDDVGSQNVMKYASGYGKSLPQGLKD